jgi:uncharacterized cupin superfamily protein
MIPAMPTTIHWDDCESFEADLGLIGGRWTGLAQGAGARRLGVNRIQVPPGKAATPQHAEDEELFFVLGGSGWSVQEDGTFAIRAGDTVYYRAWRPAHTVVAGDDGLDVIAMGVLGPFGGVRFPRLGVVKVMDLLVSGDTTHQWELEAALGPIELPAEPDPRPATIANLDELEPRRFGPTRAWGLSRHFGVTGLALNYAELAPGGQTAPLHCHSMEEELFVVLAGDGALVLGRDETEHPLRTGSVVSRLPGTGEAHTLRAGSDGMSVLMFSDRHGSDMCFYPRSGKVAIRGLGLTFRPELVPWGDA